MPPAHARKSIPARAGPPEIAAEELKQGDYAGVVEELDGMGIGQFCGITGSILRAGAGGEGKLEVGLKSLDPVGENGLAIS